MRYDISNYEYLKARLAEVASDDLALPWQTYPCLMWDRKVGSTGYAAMDFKGEHLSAIRVAYGQFKGPIPNRSQIRHHCGIASCFRPCHLFVPNDATNLEYLMAEIKDLHDDPSRPWSDYPCLFWKFGTINGYGCLRVSGANVRAPRLAYSIANGIELESKDFICHRCDVLHPEHTSAGYPAYRLCFRPSHMFLGTSADNSGDMAAKGRSAWGERSGHSRLTEDQVHELRRLYASGIGGYRLGKRFGISKTAVRYIIIGRTWNHLPHQTNHGVSK